jgi:hypothetical protein
MALKAKHTALVSVLLVGSRQAPIPGHIGGEDFGQMAFDGPLHASFACADQTGPKLMINGGITGRRATRWS